MHCGEEAYECETALDTGGGHAGAPSYMMGQSSKVREELRLVLVVACRVVRCICCVSPEVYAVRPRTHRSSAQQNARQVRAARAVCPLTLWHATTCAESFGGCARSARPTRASGQVLCLLSVLPVILLALPVADAPRFTPCGPCWHLTESIRGDTSWCGCAEQDCLLSFQARRHHALPPRGAPFAL